MGASPCWSQCCLPLWPWLRRYGRIGAQWPPSARESPTAFLLLLLNSGPFWSIGANSVVSRGKSQGQAFSDCGGATSSSPTLERTCFSFFSRSPCRTGPPARGGRWLAVANQETLLLDRPHAEAPWCRARPRHRSSLGTSQLRWWRTGACAEARLETLKGPVGFSDGARPGQTKPVQRP